MKITPKLDIDNDIENIPSGELAHSSNIIVNNTNDAILTENGIKLFYGLEDNEEIVGRIACSDEFLIFTSNSRIIRINEIDNSIKDIKTNWQWEGGEVVGCYTYNAKKDLIIAISERIDYNVKKVPLKVINLDDPNYVPGYDDNNYTLAPNIPNINLMGYEFSGATFIDKGVYTFFVRYKHGEDYTHWIPFGYPINVFNTDNNVCIEEVWYAMKFTSISGLLIGGLKEEDKQKFASFRYDKYFDDSSAKVAKNIVLHLDIDRLNTIYEQYQIGYIVTTTENATNAYITRDYNINDNTIIINCKNYENIDITIDDLTATYFNIFNAKILCNYNNRVYLANYNEENPNIDIKDIDFSGVNVVAVSYKPESIETNIVNSISANDIKYTRIQTKSVSPRINNAGITWEEFKNKSFVVGHAYLFILNVNYQDIKGDGTNHNDNVVLMGVCEEVEGFKAIRFHSSVFHTVMSSINNIPITDANSFYDAILDIEFRNYAVYYTGSKYSKMLIDRCDNNSNISMKYKNVDNLTILDTIRFGNDIVDNPNFTNDTNTIRILFNNTQTGLNGISLTYIYDLHIEDYIVLDNPFHPKAPQTAWYYNGVLECDDGQIFHLYDYADDRFNKDDFVHLRTKKNEGAYTTLFRNARNVAYVVKFDGNNTIPTDIIGNALAAKLNTSVDDVYNTYNITTLDVMLDDNFNEVYDEDTTNAITKPRRDGNNYIIETLTYNYVKQIIEFSRLLYSVTDDGTTSSNFACTKIIAISRGSDKIKLVNKQTQEVIEYSANDLFPGITFVNNKNHLDYQQIVDYYVDGIDPNDENTELPTVVWEWTQDIEPNDTDYNPNTQYNIDAYKASLKNGTISPNNLINAKITGITPKAVGYKNYQYGEPIDGVQTNTVDKSFCVIVDLVTIFSLTQSRENTTNPVKLVVNGADGEQILAEGNIDDFYVLFEANSTTNFGGENVIIGKLCKIQDDSSLNDNIPRFDYLIDITYSGTADENHPAFSYTTTDEEGNEVTEYAYSIPLFYATRITTENIYDDVVVEVTSEYKKTAINHAVYNFFLHYVYPDGSYTDGVQLTNNAPYNVTLTLGGGLTYECDWTTTCYDIKQYIEEESGDIELFQFDNTLIFLGLAQAIRDGLQVHICNIIPQFNENNISVYVNNNGDRLFRGTDNNEDNNIGNGFSGKMQNFITPIKFVFNNIPRLNNFVGYFISYEKTEPIMIGRGPYTCDYSDTSLLGAEKRYGYNEPYESKHIPAVRLIYPEFSVLNQAAGVNFFYQEDKLQGGKCYDDYIFADEYEIEQGYSTERTGDEILNGFNYIPLVYVKRSQIVMPDDISFNNYGREGALNLANYSIEDVNYTQQFTIECIKETITLPPEIYPFNNKFNVMYNPYGIAMNINDNLYMNVVKNLIPLGYIKYYNNRAYDGTYGNDDFPYNYDYYKNDNFVIAFNKYGTVYDEITSVPTFGQYPVDEEKDYLDYDDSDDGYLYSINGEYGAVEANYFNRKKYGIPIVVNSNKKKGHAPLCLIHFSTYNTYDVLSCQIDNPPVEKVYTLYDGKITQAKDKENKDIRNVHTIFIYPRYVNDLIKLPSCYNEYTSKLVTNYDEEQFYNFITYYDKTIRRSDIMSDESVENRWRIFRPDNYKIIQENKGSIINVVGVGRYLIAHCEHSLFLFDRTNQLSTDDKDVQMIIPDTFEIDYSEVFPTDKGFGGLQGFNHWCVSNYGYIFLDKDSKKVYRFDDNKLDELTPGMYNLFMHIEDAKFGIDYQNNRMICIGELTTGEQFTISYHFDSRGWVSTHTYWYKDIFNTKLNTYFIINNSIHTFDKQLYNSYTNIINHNNFFKSEILNNMPMSYVDIVFNNNGIDKVLDYITYRINKATDDQYSGNQLMIYTNVCYSDYKDISAPRRRVSDWKSPVFRYGIWVVNWFRNWIKPIPTVPPIIRGNGKLDPNAGEYGRQVNNNALMVGKYWVIRLIFGDNNRRISLDDVQTY